MGAGNGFEEAYATEIDRRPGPERERLAELSAIPVYDLTLEPQREMCLLQWRPNFSPGPAAAEHGGCAVGHAAAGRGPLPDNSGVVCTDEKSRIPGVRFCYP